MLYTFPPPLLTTYTCPLKSSLSNISRTHPIHIPYQSNQISWAYDGYRSSRWSNKTAEPYGWRWRSGDVVGVLLDIDLLEMKFYLNGEDLGTAFLNFSGPEMFPALSLNVRQSVRINFGQYRFQYPPDEIDGKAYHAVWLASEYPRVKMDLGSGLRIGVNDVDPTGVGVTQGDGPRALMGGIGGGIGGGGGVGLLGGLTAGVGLSGVGSGVGVGVGVSGMIGGGSDDDSRGSAVSVSVSQRRRLTLATQAQIELEEKILEDSGIESLSLEPLIALQSSENTSGMLENDSEQGGEEKDDGDMLADKEEEGDEEEADRLMTVSWTSLLCTLL